jgi:AraC-like DNA-binding protein
MPDSHADTDELVARGVRELLEEHEEGERLGVAAKARELGVHKDQLHRRLKGAGPCIGRKAINRKLSAMQEASLMRYILSLNEIGHSVRYD